MLSSPINNASTHEEASPFQELPAIRRLADNVILKIFNHHSRNTSVSCIRGTPQLRRNQATITSVCLYWRLSAMSTARFWILSLSVSRYLCRRGGAMRAADLEIIPIPLASSSRRVDLSCRFPSCKLRCPTLPRKRAMADRCGRLDWGNTSI